MAKFSAVHTSRKTKLSFKHNYRLEENHPNINKELTKNNPSSNLTIEEAEAKINDLYKQAFENYSEFCKNQNGIAKRTGKPKGLQNFTKKENATMEFIYEIKEDTTLEDCEKLSKAIGDLLGFTPIQISIHRDEGHTDKNGNFIIHHHAHASFFTLDDKHGLQLNRSGEEKPMKNREDYKRKEPPIKPTMTRENLSKVQDLAAEILKMQRGKSVFKNDEVKEYIEDYREYKKIKKAETEFEIAKQKNIKQFYKNVEKAQHDIDRQNQEIKAKENELFFKENETEAKHKLAKEKLEEVEKLEKDLEENYKKKVLLLNEDEAKLNKNIKKFEEEKQVFYKEKQEEDAILKKYNVDLENITNPKDEKGWGSFIKVFNNDEEKAKAFLDNHTKKVVFQLSKSMGVIIEKAENIINENERAKNPNHFRDRSLSQDFEKRINDFMIQHTHSKEAKKDLERKNKNQEWE